MATALGSLIRQATRRVGEPYRVISACTHESYETCLSQANIEVYALQGPQIKTWDTSYRPIPKNYHILNKNIPVEQQIPPHINFDAVLSQHKFGQYQLLRPVADFLHLPLISLEHTLALPTWNQQTLAALKNMRGNINLFISEYSRDKWGWNCNEADIIHHGIDTDIFDSRHRERKPVILSVVNDWINRGDILGFPMWQRITQGLPVKVLGKTAGLSEPAKDVEDLANHYSESAIFLNTSLYSPIPSVILEAMAAGMPVVSTATCMIPEIICHGINGLLSNDENELRKYCTILLQDKDLRERLGRAARKTILAKFSLDRFKTRWNEILEQASKVIFTGVR